MGLVAGGLALPAMASSYSSANAAPSTVEEAVAFTVVNTNTSGAPCASDQATYTIRGHITGPAALLASRRASSISVYLFGMDAGEWNWHLKTVRGYDFAENIARLGHVSLTIDELGYGASGKPADGNLTCVGAEVDVAHQIVQQLRSGSYRVTGGAPIKFHRVALAGHDVGALVAEVEAYSYADVDALIEVTWADQGHSQFIVQRSLTASTQWCTTGTGSRPAPASYVKYATEADWHSWMFHDADPAVVAATDRLRNRNPCGVIRSLVTSTVPENPYSVKNAAGVDPGNFPLSRLTTIKVPILIVFGADDTHIWSRQGEQEQQENFSGSSDKTTVFIPDAAHFPMFERTAPRFLHVMSDWLARHQA